MNVKIGDEKMTEKARLVLVAEQKIEVLGVYFSGFTTSAAKLRLSCMAARGIKFFPYFRR